MDVSKNKRKNVQDKSSASNRNKGPNRKMDVEIKGGKVSSNKGGNKKITECKRKISEMTNDAVSPSKKFKAEILSSSKSSKTVTFKDDTSSPSLNGKDALVKSLKNNKVNKPNKMETSSPKVESANKKESREKSSVAKEKVQDKSGKKIINKKKQLVPEINDRKQVKGSSNRSSTNSGGVKRKHNDNAQKEDFKPLPEKMKKQDEKAQNQKIRKVTKNLTKTKKENPAVDTSSKKSSEKIKKEDQKAADQKNKKSSNKFTKIKKESSAKNSSSKNSKTKSAKPKAPVESKLPDINADDPMAMLMMMEGAHSKPPPPVFSLSAKPTASSSVSMSGSDFDDDDDEEQNDAEEMDDSEDSELSDWEDVKDYSLPLLEEERSQVPTDPVEITLDMPNILKKKRKKKEFDWKEYLIKRVRKFKKEVAINIHKSHILCLIAYGLRQNSVLKDETVKGLCASLIPSHLSKSSVTCFSTERLVDSALSWYKKTFPLDQVRHASGDKLIPVHAIVDAFSRHSIVDARIWVFVFIILLRSLGMSVRLVLSLQPIPFKVSENATSSSSSSKKPKNSKGKSHTTSKMKTTSSSSSQSLNQKQSLAAQQSPSSSLSTFKSTASSSKSTVASVSRLSSSMKSASSSSSSSSSKSANKSKISSTPLRSPSGRRSSLEARKKSQNNLKDDEEFDDGDDDGNDEDADLSEKHIKTGKDVKGKKGKHSTVKKTKPGNEEPENSDSDFEETSPYFRRSPPNLKVKSNRKILSEDDEDSQHGGGHDFWLEVFLEDKKKWACFDCFKNVFGKPYSFEGRATQPVAYVVAFRNDNGVRDVTARYARQWLSHTRKLRVDADWLEETFTLFGKATYQEVVMEEDQIKSQLMVRPMPSSVGDFKNHPLYALSRHLLKFEAIYPETAIPLGYIKKEPIYARECVRTLHSRDNWLKEGRLVRLKEEPYKMVKSRPKWNKPKENPNELDLELYGEWQTEIYIPLPAVNGKVPKNEYGNVELFKPWMLPAGTVQLKVQGLQRVAKKLNIDVAPAMIGWDHHSGHAHPVFDGFIVCQEHADALLIAWDEDQEIHKQREDEKRDKRVYGNWRLLIRGLLIKERLKNKFLLEDAPLLEGVEDTETKTTSQGKQASTSNWSAAPGNGQKTKGVQGKRTPAATKSKKAKC